ncbi:MAG: transporter substrate-binding domain-containing protein [Clostridia bacterium]|nr:transporter substrate-binding domain-containing protein [Clostridia bacterium]
MKKTLASILALVLLFSMACLAEGEIIGRLSMISVGIEDLPQMAEESQYLDDQTDAFVQNMMANQSGQIEFDNLTTMLMALNADDVTALGVNASVAQYIVARNDSLQWTPNVMPIQDSFCMMVMEENRDIYDLLNNALTEMKADGTLDSLIENELQACIYSDPKPVKLPEIKGAQIIRVAVTGDLPPMDYVAVDGTPAGFNMAVLAEIARRAQVNIETMQVDSAARSTALASGRVDAIFWTKGVISPDGTILWSETIDGALATEIYFADTFARVTKK